MGADAGIFQQYLNPIRSIADYSADLDKAESNKLALVGQRRQNEIAGLQADATRQSVADAAAKQNAIRQIYASNPTADPIARARLLQANPLTANEGIAAEKGILDNDKTRAGTAKDQADADAKAADSKYKAFDHHAQGLAYVQSPQDVVTYIDQGISKGIFPASAREQMLAKAQQYPSIDAWRKASEQAMVPVLEKFKSDAEMARAQLSSDTQVKTTQMSNDTSRANNSATVAQAERGSVRADARAREANALGKVPAGYRANADGTLSAIPGGPADPAVTGGKALTDSQAKALLFGSRMQESDKILNNLSAKGVDRPSLTKTALDSIPLVGGALGGAANAAGVVVSPDQQSVEQAQRDFVNAVLRRESGAAISPGEFDSAQKQYFPSVGDSDQVKKQKAANRNLAIRGLLAEVPPGQRETLSKPGATPAPSASAAPAPAAAGWSISPVK